MTNRIPEPLRWIWMSVYPLHSWESRNTDMYGYPIIGKHERPMFCMEPYVHANSWNPTLGPTTSDVWRLVHEMTGTLCSICVFTSPEVRKELANL